MNERLQEEIRKEAAKNGISEAMAWHVVMTREIQAGRIVPLSAEGFDPSQPRDENGRWTSGAPSDAEVSDWITGFEDQQDDMSQPFLTRKTKPARASDFFRKGMSEGDEVDFGEGRKAKVGKGDVAFEVGGKEVKRMKWGDLTPVHRKQLHTAKARNAGFKTTGGTHMYPNAPKPVFASPRM